MRKIDFKFIPLLILMIIGTGMNAQNALWKKVSVSETSTLPLEERNSTPVEFDVYELNAAAFINKVLQAPERFTSTSNVFIDFPIQGKLEKFRVYEASNFDPVLQAQFPNIRSFVAQGVEDPTMVARFSTSDFGIQVMVSSGNFSTVYIDPYTQDKKFYMVYHLDKLPEYDNNFQCHYENPIGYEPDLDDIPDFNANDGTLRTYRLALACTRFYANFHLNRLGIPSSATDEEKKAGVMVAFNEAMTRINGIYERDAALTMVLVPNNTDLIFLTASTDPYSNNDVFAMLQQNQTTVDAKIGPANYDIGHVFGTGPGGVAMLRSPCVNGMKARGVTGLPQPHNDQFWVDFVSHEMGHQYGANHTFNNSCQNNRNTSTAMEPGSGSTIMSYAGTCPPNVQNRSDAYFHAISLQEMWSNIKHGAAQCGAQTSTNNDPPTADAGGNKTIPKGTPFILTGTGTDPNDPTGASLTYTWEQMNPQPAQMPPVNTSTQGPMFRSVQPSDSPSRYMPMIQTVINGNTQNTWEVVPTVGRTMNFRFTVRDNHAGGGSSASDNMRVTVDGASGPFVITSQNDPVTWVTQTTETITWDVAGTNGGEVNTSHVDIFFSDDGGMTYSRTLASNVPNNGSAVINVPNLNTSRGRVMVKGAGNIFYDINNANITVTGEIGVEDFDFASFAVYPNPSSGVFNLRFVPEATDAVQVSLYDLRGRLIHQNNFNNVSGSMFQSELDYSAIGSGVYFLVVENGGKRATKKLIKN